MTMHPPFVHDETYFWDTVCFAVEGCLFKVPRDSFVAASETFAETYKLNSRNWSIQLDGYSEDQPIYLANVTVEEFRTLLKLIFPTLTASGELSFSKKEWLHILKLATLWCFTDFRKLAISKLEDGLVADAVEHIDLARKYSISAWLISGLTQLVSQDEPISEEQSIAIELMTALRLYIIRDTLKKASTGSQSPSPAYTKPPDVSIVTRGLVEKTFAEEVRDLKDREMEHLTAEEKKAEDRLRAKTTKEHELEQLKAKIENAKLTLKNEEDTVEKMRLALEEEERRLEKAIEGPHGRSGPPSNGKKKGRK